MIIVTKQINLDQKSMLKALQRAAYDQAVADGENVGSFDAFCMKTADSTHYLAADGKTEVMPHSVAMVLPPNND